LHDRAHINRASPSPRQALMSHIRQLGAPIKTHQQLPPYDRLTVERPSPVRDAEVTSSQSATRHPRAAGSAKFEPLPPSAFSAVQGERVKPRVFGDSSGGTCGELGVKPGSKDLASQLAWLEGPKLLGHMWSLRASIRTRTFAVQPPCYLSYGAWPLLQHGHRSPIGHHGGLSGS
jgi:hypothetical protein